MPEIGTRWLRPAIYGVLLTAAVPAAALTPGEGDLLERIPPTIQPACVPATPASAAPAPTAVLTCDLTATAGVMVTYERYVSHAAASARYEAQLVPDAQGKTTYIGRCPTSLPAETTYRQDGRTSGRVSCTITTDGAAKVMWLDPARAVVGTATRPAGDVVALVRWWLQTARISGSADTGLLAAGGLFPDPVEYRLLQQLNPGMPRSCFRDDFRERRPDDVLAAVVCVDTDAKVLVRVARYRKGVSLAGEYLNTIANLGVRPGIGGYCATQIPAERAYTTARGAGRYACARTSSGTNLLLWIDRKRKLRGRAISKSLDPGALQVWWRDHAR